MSFASGELVAQRRHRWRSDMEVQPQQQAGEIKRLQRCINDLVSVLALPAMWTGGDPSQIVRTVLDALMGMLRLDLIYVRLNDPAGDAPIEMVRFAQSRMLATRQDEIGPLLNRWLGADQQKWPPLIRNCIGDEDISIVPLRLGVQGDIGLLVAGCERADFPDTAAERRRESSGHRPPRGMAPSRAEASRQRARSTGCATNQRTCGSQRRAEEGNRRTLAGRREAAPRGN